MVRSTLSLVSGKSSFHSWPGAQMHPSERCHWTCLHRRRGLRCRPSPLYSSWYVETSTSLSKTPEVSHRLTLDQRIGLKDAIKCTALCSLKPAEKWPESMSPPLGLEDVIRALEGRNPWEHIEEWIVRHASVEPVARCRTRVSHTCHYSRMDQWLAPAGLLPWRIDVLFIYIGGTLAVTFSSTTTSADR